MPQREEHWLFRIRPSLRNALTFFAALFLLFGAGAVQLIQSAGGDTRFAWLAAAVAAGGYTPLWWIRARRYENSHMK